MREILISTESGSDLPPELIKRHDFHVVPMHVIIEDTDYADGTIPVDMVFEHFERTGKVPSTSAVNVAEYQEFWSKLQKEHPDCVIMHFTYSSLASSTHQAAMIAVRDFKDIYIIDTRQVSGGCTAHMVASWKRVQEVQDTVTDYQALADELQALADKAVCHFVPNKLDYLKAGGRVSNAEYLGATLLSLKPLIEMVDGKLIATKKYHGPMKRWVDKFMDDFTQKYHLRKDCLYLMYGKGLSEEVLKRMAENAKRLGFESYEYVMTGCVISCHGGKGAIGLAGMLE